MDGFSGSGRELNFKAIILPRDSFNMVECLDIEIERRHDISKIGEELLSRQFFLPGIRYGKSCYFKPIR